MIRAIMRDFTRGITFMREVSLDRPSYTISSTGIWGVSHGGYFLHDDGDLGLPPDRGLYRPQSVALARAIAGSSGLRAVSLFSGCGGSSLGLKLAGVDVRAACEFLPDVAACYRRNFPETPVLVDDVRRVSGAGLLAAAGLEPGELDLLDGSPPCTIFSTVGKRARAWGVATTAGSTGDKVQRTDDLFFEYVRLVGELRPRAFVGENVTGLVKGNAQGIFAEVVAALRAHGYRVGARVLDASWLGVPQARERVILVGFRDDLGLDPVFPSPVGPQLTMRQCLDPGRRPEAGECSFVEYPPDRLTSHGRRAIDVQLGDRRVPLRVAWDLLGKEHPLRTLSIPEARRLCGFPDDFDLGDAGFGWKWARLGNSVPPPMMAAIAGAVRDRLLEVK